MIIAGYATGATEITGGWITGGEGVGSSQSDSFISTCGSDPSITLGITSTASVFGRGSFSDQRNGSMSVSLPLGGYVISTGFDGSVNSSISLSSTGVGSVTSYVGATATGMSTGHNPAGNDSYDLFGSADIKTEGYLAGKGTASALANGSSNYGVTKSGTPAEVWGQVKGRSSLELVGLSSSSYASTGGISNGIHTESRSTETILNEKESSSTSRISSYLSVVNSGHAKAISTGVAESGSWNSDISGSKIRGQNENCASYASGELSGYVEANGNGDAADISSVIQSSSSRDPRLYVSGGPATYAAVTQNSSSSRTYAEVSAKNSTWISVARGAAGQNAMENGTLDNLTSVTRVNQNGSNAIAFGKILLYADYQTSNGTNYAMGNFSIDVLAEATKNKSYLSSTTMGILGTGNMTSGDLSHSGEGGFSLAKNMTHYATMDSSSTIRASNRVKRAFINTTPLAYETISQSARADTEADPNIAWARTDGAYIIVA
jgi:hypothetical protein